MNSSSPPLPPTHTKEHAPHTNKRATHRAPGGSLSSTDSSGLSPPATTRMLAAPGAAGCTAPLAIARGARRGRRCCLKMSGGHGGAAAGARCAAAARRCLRHRVPSPSNRAALSQPPERLQPLAHFFTVNLHSPGGAELVRLLRGRARTLSDLHSGVALGGAIGRNGMAGLQGMRWAGGKAPRSRTAPWSPGWRRCAARAVLQPATRAPGHGNQPRAQQPAGFACRACPYRCRQHRHRRPLPAGLAPPQTEGSLSTRSALPPRPPTGKPLPVRPAPSRQSHSSSSPPTFASLPT